MDAASPLLINRRIKMLQASFLFMDDFGNAERPIMPGNFLLSCVRFWLDGMIEGISEELLEGQADDSSLRFFGLIQ
jgi:hypothetical protein